MTNPFERIDYDQDPAPAGAMQAHLGNASKFAGKKTRDWSLFFFFRILSMSEMATTSSLLEDNQKASENENDAPPADANQIGASLANPGLTGAARNFEPGTGRSKPAGEFLGWLDLVSNAGRPSQFSKSSSASGGDIRKAFSQIPDNGRQTGSGQAHEESSDRETVARQLCELLNSEDGVEEVLDGIMGQIASALGDRKRMRALIDGLVDFGSCLKKHPNKIIPFYAGLSETISGVFSNPNMVQFLLETFGDTPGKAGRAALEGGLPVTCIYELLRQTAPVSGDVRKTAGSILRSEDEERALADGCKKIQSEKKDKSAAAVLPVDHVPINLAFTHSGLDSLNIDPVTLRSFPDVFRQGMAARAEQLGDTGPSAPENWEGEFGLPGINGYFTGGFQAGDGNRPVPEKVWRELRSDIREFNNRSGPRGRFLRLLLRAVFRIFGMEIVHIELGQAPYDASGKNKSRSLKKYRREHFGFRDGISQPDIDPLNRLAGSGTPRRDRTWAPVSLGEIFLGYPDEDGQIHAQPAHSGLRNGGTFVVFRKLEQDVLGFRNFLKKQRPGNAAAQEKLAAQFMGRWKDGTPLVVSPDRETRSGSDPERQINDFLYAADDPLGQKCPLGAHVRRSNPRDIGGNNDVKRHRILRRGIAYGGPLLPEASKGDGEPRGLLFIAVNARIDLQFEVVQANWINSGEFLGQAGLGRCPISGSNTGGLEDSFLETGAVAPVRNIPSFVTMRGGDYFFAPGPQAIREIAGGNKFGVDMQSLPFGGFSMGDAHTPELFTEDRIKHFIKTILTSSQAAIEVRMEQAPTNGRFPVPHDVHEDPMSGAPVVFVGRHKHVHHVLSTNWDNPKNNTFSVPHYHRTGRWLTRGNDMLVGTHIGKKSGKKRKQMSEILRQGWFELTRHVDVSGKLKQTNEQTLSAALRRTEPAGRIDLVRDLATETSYHAASEIFGVAGPDWLTELAFALPFAQQHVGRVPPEWLVTLKAEKPENPGLATLQLWSAIILADMIGNVRFQQELRDLSLQAGSEMTAHIHRVLDHARTHVPSAPHNLVDAFVAVEKNVLSDPLFGKYTPDDYYADVNGLLLELVGEAMAAIPAAFGTMMGALLDFRIDLTALLPALEGPPKSGTYTGVQRLIYETDRLKPSTGIFMRRCEKDHTLPEAEGSDPVALKAGQWVAAMTIAADLDPAAFPDPRRFSLHPYLPGPMRPEENYLLFGATGGGRDCWGRDKIALNVLEACMRAGGRLDGLRRVPGEQGEDQKLAGVTVGLPARFSSLS